MSRCVDLIVQEWQRRHAKNPRYSIRAFSRAVGVSYATLSRIIARKQQPSIHVCAKIIKQFSVESDRADFLEAVAEDAKERIVARLR